MDPAKAKSMLDLFYAKKLDLSPQDVENLHQVAMGNSMTSQPQSQSPEPPPLVSGPMPADQNQKFNEWYAAHSIKNKINPNVDDPEQHYDTRDFYRSMMNGTDESPELHHGHMSSEFKEAENLRAFLTDSKGKTFNTMTGKYLDGKTVPEKELSLSETTPTPKRATGKQVYKN